MQQKELALRHQKLKVINIITIINIFTHIYNSQYLQYVQYTVQLVIFFYNGHLTVATNITMQL